METTIEAAEEAEEVTETEAGEIIEDMETEMEEEEVPDILVDAKENTKEAAVIEVRKSELYLLCY